MEAEWARSDWEQELDPQSERVQAGVKASRGGIEGRVERRDTSSTDSEGVSNHAAVTAGVDSKGVRMGGELTQSSGPDTRRGGGSIGTDGVKLYGKSESKVDGGKLNGSGSISMGPAGLAAKGGMGVASGPVAMSTLADPAQDSSSHRAPGAAMQAKASASVSGTASGDLTAKEPKQVPGGYIVEWSGTASVGAMSAGSLSWEGLELGGDKSIGGIPGARGSGELGTLGGSASVGLDGRLEGVAFFRTKEEATAFRARPVPYLPARTADGALGMAEGERSRLSLTARAGLGLSAGGTGAPTAGAGAQASGTAGVQVERVEGDIFAVTRDLSGDLSGHVGLGAPGLDLAGQATTGTVAAATWQLDLSTESGRAGYEALLSGQTPEPGPGVTLPDKVGASFDATSTSVSMPGGSVQVGGRSTDQELSRSDGTRRLSEEGVETQRVSPWKLLRGLFPQSDADTGLNGITELDASGGETGSEVRIIGRSESNAARYNYEGIGRAGAVGDAYNPRAGESTRGQWTVETTFGARSLDRLAAKVEHERFDDPSYLRLLTTAERRFVEQMRAASGDRDKQRAAVQELGEHGVEAAMIVRKLLGSGETYVSLEGSETWIGEEGHGEVEREIQEATRAVEYGDVGPAETLRGLLFEHTARLHDLTDYGKYQDVPSTLREKEIKRTRVLIMRMKSLLERTGASTGADSDPLAAAVERQRQVVEDTYESLRSDESRHGVGHDRYGVPWDTLTDRGLFGGGPESARYAAVESSKLRGEAARREAGELERALLDALQDEVPPAELEATRAAVLQELTVASTSFASALVVLRAIEADHQELFGP